MKRAIVALVLCLVCLLCVALAGCGKTGGKDPSAEGVTVGDDGTLEAGDIFGEPSQSSAPDGTTSSDTPLSASNTDGSQSDDGLVRTPSGEIDYEAKENWTKPVGGDKTN